MTSSQAGSGGEFKANIPPLSQNLPGLEKELAPTPESTRLEGPTGFREYVGSGKLRDYAVLITGGDSGIGRSVAALMAREGADCTIVHLPQEQPDAEDAKKLVESAGRKCLLVPFDLENYKDAGSIIEKHMKEYGRLDTLVNNASKQMQCKEFSEIDLDNVSSTFNTNILQMFAVTKYALPHMKKGSSIINTTSVVAFRGTPSMVDYAATKGAIASFTRALAKNLTPKGIRVNAVAPGPVHTPLQPSSRPDEQMEGFGSKSQIGRPGQPSEVATSYVFLASAEASLYYGQILHPYPLGD
ncbi:oxidoreductase [Choiromyces venosus 120613-1]|uniref:Oxidoreductase n=1 Tax=Choiromyces venosus 120613-1 TaxID=1336337 RepID=A0A3N4KEN8_9PEZI|nr:oxidoreductase [Choiromyces venosus 120613-1]